MADRYLGDGKNLVKIGAPHNYKTGDIIFYSVAATSWTRTTK